MTDSTPLPPPAAPPATPPAASPAAPPFLAAELRALWITPGHACEVLLTDRERLAATVAAGPRPWPLVAVLLACTALATIPYGFARGGAAFWKVGALFGGATLLCFPSLQVFSAYLGSRLQPVQNLALSLLVAAVAALFTLGFSPIVWFLGLTMAKGDWIDAGGASVALLAAALFAGLAQLLRCARLHAGLLPCRGSFGLLLGWMVLLGFVALRLARELDLLG